MSPNTLTPRILLEYHICKHDTSSCLFIYFSSGFLGRIRGGTSDVVLCTNELLLPDMPPSSAPFQVEDLGKTRVAGLVNEQWTAPETWVPTV